MKINNKHLRGVTLTEFIIVLAVLAIISTIVISFVLISNENIRSSSQKVDALNDIAVVEEMVESWLSAEMDNLSLYYFENERKEDRFITNNKQTSILYWDNGKLHYVLNGVEISYKSETIKNLEITFQKKGDEKLAICYITYELVLSNNEKKEYTYSFVVYPYKNIEMVTQGGN